jgi:pSer/pThr/pTyr-binding forkhead associated (FHA) protein
VQAETAEAQALELDNWKEKWAEVVASTSEKESRLTHLESDLKVRTSELAVRSERITTLTRTITDQAQSISALEQEVRDKSESLSRIDGDVRAAEEAMLRLESQVRQKTEQLSSVQRASEEQRAQIKHLQDTLASRDATISRLETELRSSSDIIGNIQRDIRRLSASEPAPAASAPPAAAAPAAETLARLLVRIDGDTEVVHVINKRTTSIGRTDDNDVAIDTKFISRHHARILCGPNYTVLEDLGSTNGVYVNNRRINRRHTIVDGDIVMIGETRFRFALKTLDRS